MVLSKNMQTYIRATSKLIVVVENLSGFLETNMEKLQPLDDDGAAAAKHIPMKSDELERQTMESKLQKIETDTSTGTSNRIHTSGVSSVGDIKHAILTPLRDIQGLQPFASFVNLVLCGLKPGQGRTGASATLLVNNPVGCCGLSFELFVKNIQSVFGLRGMKIRLFLDSKLTQELSRNTQVNGLHNKTLFVAPNIIKGSVACPGNTVTGPICHYVNFECKGKVGTLLLENPAGEFLSLMEFLAQASIVLGLPLQDLQFNRSQKILDLLNIINEQDLAYLHGRTIIAL